MSQENVDLVKGGYDDFNSGNIEGLTARFDPEIEWVEPGGGNAPAGTFKGPESIVNDVFNLVPANFDEFSCTVAEADDQGDAVVVTADFKGKNKSGADLDMQAKHTWQVRDGKVVRFENEIDQAAWAQAWS
jgi:ketosteroid isomerase-like protein